MFKLTTEYTPRGDQPNAIDQIVAGYRDRAVPVVAAAERMSLDVKEGRNRQAGGQGC
jgi:hypothetical protein